MELTAPVFNVQTYSIHDGPGIRVTVFVKGCPLRCRWCANPESNLARPQRQMHCVRPLRRRMSAEGRFHRNAARQALRDHRPGALRGVRGLRGRLSLRSPRDRRSGKDRARGPGAGPQRQTVHRRVRRRNDRQRRRMPCASGFHRGSALRREGAGLPPLLPKLYSTRCCATSIWLCWISSTWTPTSTAS